MPEEIATTQTPVESIDAGTIVAAENKEPEVPETPEVVSVPPPVEKPAVDNSESSRLGRKVKELSEKLDATLNHLNRLEHLSGKPAGNSESYEIDPDTLVTSKDVSEIIRRHDDRKKTSVDQYQRTYIEQIDKLTLEENDPSLAKEIADEVFVLQGAQYTKSELPTPEEARIDAERNYLKAARVVMSKRVVAYTKPQNPLKGMPPKAPLGVNVGSKVNAAPLPPINLPPDAVAYAQKMGMSEEKIREALAGDTPGTLIKGTPK